MISIPRHEPGNQLNPRRRVRVCLDANSIRRPIFKTFHNANSMFFSSFQPALQSFRHLRAAQLPHCLILNLTDSFAGQIEQTANFF